MPKSTPQPNPLLEGTENNPQQTFQRFNDPYGNLLIGLNRDGTITCQGIEIPQSAPISSVVPVLQAKITFISTKQSQAVSYTATEDALFNVSIFMESEGDGLTSDTVLGTLTWGDPSSGEEFHSIVCSLLGGPGVENIVMETYPILVEAGTLISFSTSFGANPITYDLAVRLVQMP